MEYRTGRALGAAGDRSLRDSLRPSKPSQEAVCQPALQMPPPDYTRREDRQQLGDRPSDVAAHDVEAATAPARWLLEAGSNGGVALTATYALARAVVREAADRWPGWWNAELFGPPHREADLAVLEALHDGLRRLKLVRRRARKLHTTARGRELAGDAAALLRVLIADLGGGDPFTEAVAAAVTGKLAAGAPCEHDDLVASALRETRAQGGRTPMAMHPPSATSRGSSVRCCAAARRTA
jgi:hypothetical protein